MNLVFLIVKIDEYENKVLQEISRDIREAVRIFDDHSKAQPQYEWLLEASVYLLVHEAQP